MKVEGESLIVDLLFGLVFDTLHLSHTLRESLVALSHHGFVTELELEKVPASQTTASIEAILFGLDSCLPQPAKSLIAVVTWYSIAQQLP